MSNAHIGGVMFLSVVVPMFNEEAALPFFAQRMRPVLDGMSVTYEVGPRG